MENKKINSKIMKLWRKHKEKFNKVFPTLYPEFNKNQILFIGFNASMNDNIINKVLKEIKKDIKNKEKYKNLDMNNCFNPNDSDKEFIVLFEKAVRKEGMCQYFNKFHKFDNNFDHIDLFYFRMTSQKDANDVIGIKKDNDGNITKINKFGEEQLKITFGIINEAEPRCIVVANALASDIMLSYEPFKSKIDKSRFEKFGYDYYDVNGKKIPIVFSSMLSGQRALDNHSFRRLKWLINRATGVGAVE